MRSFIGGLVIGLAAGVLLAVTLPGGERGLDGGNAVPVGGAKGSGARNGLQWKMASAFPGSMVPWGPLAKRTAASIGTATGGRLTVAFHEPGALVPALDLFDTVSSGAVEAGFAQPGLWAAKAPALQLFGAIPFGPQPTEFLAWFDRGGGRQEFEAIYHKRNIHGLLCGIAVPGGGWFKREVEQPGDLNGLRLAASGLAAKVLAQLGAKPSRMAPGDVAEGFKAGALDGAVGMLPSAGVALKLNQSAKFQYFPGWHRQAGALELLVNLPRWRALDDDAKAGIEAVCAANLGKSLAESEAGQFAALKELVLAGVEVRQWKPAMIDALRNAWRSVASEQASENQDFRRVWKQLGAFREDYAIWRELGYL